MTGNIRLRWEKHGDVHVGVDQWGWTRAFLHWQQSFYLLVYEAGQHWFTSTGANRRELMRTARKACK